MELEELFGLPAHPLFVHIPVVIIPMAGVVAVVFAFRPPWLDRFGWGLVAFAGFGMVGAMLASSSGEGLEDMMEDNRGTISSSLRDHAELGETARNVSVLFFLVILGAVVLRRVIVKRTDSLNGILKFAASRAGAIVIACLLVFSSAAATATVVAAGHSGAKQVWHENDSNGRSGSGGAADGYDED